MRAPSQVGTPAENQITGPPGGGNLWNHETPEMNGNGSGENTKVKLQRAHLG